MALRIAALFVFLAAATATGNSALRLQGSIEPVRSHSVVVPRLASAGPGSGPGPGTLVIVHLVKPGTRVKRGDLLIEFDRQAQIKAAHEWLRTEQHDRWLGFDRGDIRLWFQAAGLEDVTVADTNEICSPTSTCGTQAAITIFIAHGRKPIG